MRERGWSATQLFEAVGPALGYSAKSRSALLPLLADREPKPEQADILRRVLGGGPEDLPEPVSAGVTARDTGSDLTAIVAALDAQTAAMQELVEEMRLTRRARETWEQAILETLAAGAAEVRSAVHAPALPEGSPR